MPGEIMAKSQEEPVVSDQPIATRSTPAAVAAEVTYRDKVYTSRTLILPKGRELAVVKGVVTVSTSDAGALQYLKENAEFEQLQE
jgi:hypothetical protein